MLRAGPKNSQGSPRESELCGGCKHRGPIPSKWTIAVVTKVIMEHPSSWILEKLSCWPWKPSSFPPSHYDTTSDIQHPCIFNPTRRSNSLAKKRAAKRVALTPSACASFGENRCWWIGWLAYHMNKWRAYHIHAHMIVDFLYIHMIYIQIYIYMYNYMYIMHCDCDKVSVEIDMWSSKLKLRPYTIQGSVDNGPRWA